MSARELNFYTVGKVCAEVNLNLQQPVVDLSEVIFFKPFGLVYLGMFLRFFSGRGKEFLINLPENLNARRYLARQNFWERFNFDEETIDREQLHRLTTSTSLNDIVDIERNDYIGDEIGEQLIDVCSLVAPLYHQERWV